MVKTPVNSFRASFVAMFIAAQIVFCGFTSADVASAKIATPQKPLKDWLIKWTADHKTPPPGILSHTGIVTVAKNNSVEPVDVDSFEFNRSGFLQILRSEDVRFTMSLNNRQGVGAPGSCGTSLVSYKNCFDLDSVIVTGDGDWSLMRFDNDAVIEVVKSKAPAAGTSPAAIQKWVAEAVQYDGIVLDQDDGFILVSMFPVSSKSDAQSLLIAGSDSKYAISKNGKKGSGLLQTVEREGSFAVMSILATEYPDNKVPVGTKLMSERKP